MKLYHGSPNEFFNPTYGLGRDDHDYGKGFYTTADSELGREWAVGQRDGEDGWLHVYDVDLSGLKIFDFAEVGVLPWIAELMKHRPADNQPVYVLRSEKFIARYGIDLSGYDMIRGWRADASYFFIAQMFVRGQLDVSALERMLKLGDLGVQYFFKSEKSFGRLREIESEKERVSASVYRGRYDERDRDARNRMRSIAYDPELNPVRITFRELLEDKP